MKKIYVGEEQVALSQNEDLKLKYYVLAENKFSEELHKEITSYGVAVESFSESDTNFAAIEDITTKEENINSIINLLMKNAVTTVHLGEIIEELV